MKRLAQISGLAFLIFVLISGCKDNPTDPYENLPAKPVIKKTTNNYTAEKLRELFPDTASWNSMSRAYSNNYSEDIRNKINEYLKSEVGRMGENQNLFESILARTGCREEGNYILPVYAERARFENNEAWIVQFTYGLGQPEFGHYKYLAYSVPELDTLFYTSCR